MINKTSKSFTLILCAFLIFGCSENKFKKEGQIRSITYGLFGYDDYQFCKTKIPNFIGKYSNGINPSRICNRYQYYTCHISHYCNGDKQCELDANDYWLPNWTNAHGDQIKKAEISKRVCEAEINKCNSAPKSDQTCRK